MSLINFCRNMLQIRLPLPEYKHRQAHSQDLEKGGGGGALLKEWQKCKRPWPEFSLFLNQFHTVCPKIKKEFLGKLGNSNVFSAQNQVVFKKKERSSPKLRLIFRPNSKIQTFEGGLFSFGGALFNFLQKIGLKSSKNVQFCILHKPPPSLATLLNIGLPYLLTYDPRINFSNQVAHNGVQALLLLFHRRLFHNLTASFSLISLRYSTGYCFFHLRPAVLAILSRLLRN